MSQSNSFLRRYRDPLLVALLLAMPLIFYVSNSKAERELNALDRAVLFLSAPVQLLVVSTLDAVTHAAQRYVFLMGVAAQNAQLQAQLDECTRTVAAREELRQDNERLRKLVGLRERAPKAPMLFAEVIGTATSPLFRSIRINRGSQDGVVPGAAVTGVGGVVGRVAALGGRYADVMLLVDANSSLDVLVQRTRARARVRGQGGDETLGLDLQYLSRTAAIAPGDVLITSGLGQNFPKGLRVGTIVSAEQRAFGLYQRALAQPSVDFGRLEAVMVVLPGYASDTSLEPGE